MNRDAIYLSNVLWDELRYGVWYGHRAEVPWQCKVNPTDMFFL